MGLLSWLSGAPTEPTAAGGKHPTIGTVNVLEASIGQRGAGKSTLQCMRADELSRQWGGAYVLGHSLGARLPRALPDGRELPIVYHENLAKLERGLRRAPDRWHVLAPPIGKRGERETADDLLKFSVRLSEAIRKQAWQKHHPLGFWKPNVRMDDIEAPPIIVVIDEGIAVEAAGAGASRKEENRWFMEYLYSLRHMHVALLYAIQNPSARSWHVLDQATSIHVFSIRHRWALQSIEAAGASESEVERIKRLPTPEQLRTGERKHEHVTLAFEAPTMADIPESMQK